MSGESLLSDTVLMNKNCNINVSPRKTKDSYLLVIPSDLGKKHRYRCKCFSQNASAVGINFHMI